MRSATRFISISFFLTAVFCYSSESPGTGTLKGRVADAGGRPIVKAHVQLAETMVGCVTDQDGCFVLEQVPEGVYSLRITHIAYTKRVVSPVVIRKHKTNDLGTVYLRGTVLHTPGVSVTATRTETEVTDVPQALNLVPGSVVRQRNGKTSAEALREEPGVFIQKTSHGGGSAVIRGLSSNQILLLVDGIRLNNSTYRLGNHSYLTMVDYFTLEQLEVVRGPGSVMYGSDALGGTVNAVTSERTPEQGSGGLAYRLFGRLASADQERTWRADMSYATERAGLTGGISIKRFKDLRRGSRRSTPGLEHSQNGAVQKPSGFDCLDWNYKLVCYPAKTTKVTVASQYTRKTDLPRYDKYENNGYYKWFYDPQQRQLSYLRINQSLNNPYVSSVQATLSYHNQQEGRLTQKSQESAISREWVGVKTGGLSVQFHSYAYRHLFTYGTDIYHDRVGAERHTQDPVTLEMTADEQARYPDGSEYTSLGLFVQDEIAVSAALKGILGVRYSAFYAEFSLPHTSPAAGLFGTSVHQDFSSVTGSAGLIWDVTGDVHVTVNAGQAFRAPNLSDISKLGESKGSVFEIPNPGLKPEQMTSVDAGLKVSGGNLSAAASVYYAGITDLIASADALYGADPYIERNGTVYKVKSKQNTGRAYVCGLESAVSCSWNSLNVFANITLPYGWNVTQNEPVGGIPPFFGLAGVRRRLSRGFVEGFVRFASKQDRLSADDLDDPRIPQGGTPGWHIVTVRAEYDLSRCLRINACVENIFDINYREHGSGINGPGRNFILSLELKRGPV